MRRLMLILGLELYAAVLAGWQLMQGVRTDEAKYLMDIPYPHPPLARGILSSFDGWVFQEHLWRFVFATLMVQAVWLVLNLVRDAHPHVRVSIAACWLLCSAVVVQAGSVMMAPLTALEGLVFVWLLLRGKDNTRYAWLIALFWLASLFTAYQAVLFAPVVFMVFLRMRLPLWKRVFLFCVPVGLLALYTLTNPLVPASILNHTGKDGPETLSHRVLATIRLWLLGGSGVLSLAGLAGTLRKTHLALLGSLLLVGLYIFISRYDYYAILFTPLLIAGALPLVRTSVRRAAGLAVGTAIGTAIVLATFPFASPSPSEEVMSYIESQGVDEVMINGSFGHEWQYSSLNVRRYRPELVHEADAIVCITPCTDIREQADAWYAPDLPVEVWVRK